jgi:HK97 family phage portal protein
VPPPPRADQDHIRPGDIPEDPPHHDDLAGAVWLVVDGQQIPAHRNGGRERHGPGPPRSPGERRDDAQHDGQHSPARNPGDQHARILGPSGGSVPLTDILPGLGHRGTRRAGTVTEAASPIVAQSPARNVTRSGFTYGVPPGGMDEVQSGLGASTQTDRKSLMEELYEGYLSCPWAWASVQAIARTITAGGLETEWIGDDGEGDQDVPDKPPAVLALEALLAFVNPQSNIRQLLRNFIADLEVFGDAYIEVVWAGNRPVALYNQDSPTTTPLADVHGNVSGYVQVTDFGQKAEFKPREMIHVALDAARPGVLGVSPMQAAMGSVTAWLFAQATGKQSFKKGLPANVHADFPAAAQEKEIRTWKDQHATRNVGAANIGAPIVTKGGAKLTELQTGRISDVINGKDQYRDEILSIFGVPPAEAGVIESGNIGGGTGDSQHRTYQINTCKPVGELVAEALTYHLAVRAFGITDWLLKFGDVDYRDSTVVEQIRDTRLRNGAYTLNRYRAEIGEPPVAGGDDAVLVDRQNLVLWAQMKEMSTAMIASKGAPAVSAGERPPNGEPLTGDSDPADPADPADPSDDPNAGDPPAGSSKESLRRAQAEHYRRRVEEALRLIGTVTEGADDPATAVYAEMAKRFPADAIEWIRDADWSGPVNVGADQIDTSHSDTWAAASDGTAEKYRGKLRKKIAAGEHPKPVILVRTPGSDKDIVIDGHHRVLAALAEGRTVRAYVGKVSASTGPWLETHVSQKGGNR